MPRIDVHCDEELYQRVRERAELEGRSLSNLARRALLLYLDGALLDSFRPGRRDTCTAAPFLESRPPQDPPGPRTRVGG